MASGDDDLGRAGPPLPPPEPLVSLDSFASAGIQATRVRPEADRDLYFDTRDDATPVLAAGGSLVALTTDREGDVYRVVRSADLGKTWPYVDLPNLTASLMRLVMAEVGLAAAVRQPDGRVVVGTQGSGDARLVVTADGGASWQVVECPAMFRPAGSPRCEVAREAGGKLWIRGADVSLDAGRTCDR